MFLFVYCESTPLFPLLVDVSIWTASSSISVLLIVLVLLAYFPWGVLLVYSLISAVTYETDITVALLYL